jgi:hypothetical protein
MSIAYLHLRHPVLTFGLLALIWLEDIDAATTLVGSGKASVRGAVGSGNPWFLQPQSTASLVAIGYDRGISVIL